MHNSCVCCCKEPDSPTTAMFTFIIKTMDITVTLLDVHVCKFHCTVVQYQLPTLIECLSTAEKGHYSKSDSMA